MKKFVIIICLAVMAGLAGFAATASAEEAKIGSMSFDELKKALGMSIYLQTGYTYNENASGMTTGSGQNDLRWLDHSANSFTLDLAQIQFLKDPTAGNAGYKVKFSTGEYAKLIHSAGLGDTGSDSFDVTEAYVSYLMPMGKGLRFDFGKMGTFIGAEVLEAKDDTNYSRSLLFNYAEPLTHTGLKVSYAITDAVSAALFAVNGWDNAIDNNKAKSFGLSVGLTPAEAFSASVNVLQGPEQADNSSNKRTLVDLVATVKPLKPLSIILNYDNAKEAMGAGAPDTKWSGISGIVKYDLSDAYSIAVRAESFNDKDGVRTGTMQKLKEVTATFEARLSGGLILRPEYRHDISDKQSFDNGTKKTQNTIALGMLYAW